MKVWLQKITKRLVMAESRKPEDRASITKDLEAIAEDDCGDASELEAILAKLLLESMERVRELTPLPVYKVGDEVRATDWIRRQDGRAGLYPGGPTAIVTESHFVNNGVQIISVQAQGDLPICSLVVLKDLPLEKVQP